MFILIVSIFSALCLFELIKQGNIGGLVYIALLAFVLFVIF